jgi:hypothetical protein
MLLILNKNNFKKSCAAYQAKEIDILFTFFSSYVNHPPPSLSSRQFKRMTAALCRPPTSSTSAKGAFTSTSTRIGPPAGII